MGKKVLALRRPDVCGSCRAELGAGVTAVWEPSTRTVTCIACDQAAPSLPPSNLGRAGASALHEHDRRAARERARQEAAVVEDAAWRTQLKAKRPVLGRVGAAFRPKPTVAETKATKVWATGGQGEEQIGELLARCVGIVALHDRRVPGHGRANIDHIVVGPSGVFVVDSKRYTGLIDVRHNGTWRQADDRLYVAGRDRTSLVTAMAGQIAAVRAALELVDPAGTVPVRPVLCFVDGEFRVLRRKAIEIGGVTILWPSALAGLVQQAGTIDKMRVNEIARHLARALRSAV